MNDEQLDRALGGAGTEWKPHAAQVNRWLERGRSQSRAIVRRRRIGATGIALLALGLVLFQLPPAQPAKVDPVYAELAVMLMDLESNRTDQIDLTDIEDTIAGDIF